VHTPTSEIIPAVEVLLNNASVQKLIHGGQLDKLPAAMELGAGDGMQTFDQALYHLAQSGVISQEEALMNSPTPEALKMRFQGVVLNETRRILSART
jgi:Tfp pilus assembly ATPase PilU